MKQKFINNFFKYKYLILYFQNTRARFSNPNNFEIIRYTSINIQYIEKKNNKLNKFQKINLF